MFKYIINPKDKKKYFINSKKGVLLLKNYINLFIGGKEIVSNHSVNLNKCNNLYGQKITDEVEEEHTCIFENYRKNQSIKDSIEYKEKAWKKQHGTDLEDRSVNISNEVVKLLRNIPLFNNFLNKKNSKVITVLGPLEDILGFFYKFNSNPLYKKFFFLSVDNDEWSLDLNHDFITCTSPTKNNNFENMYEECPIILINKGKINILKEFPNQNVRVTHCEKTWINNLLENSNYKWKSIKIKDIYVNMLVKKNNLF